jgi:hypothetical protein
MGRKRSVEESVGKLFVHTAKAVRNGCPRDAAYAAVAYKGKYLISWKCTRINGKLRHPAFPEMLLETNDERLFVKKGDDFRLWIGGRTPDNRGYKTLVKVDRLYNGVGPDAVFYLDSYVTELKI